MSNLYTTQSPGFETIGWMFSYHYCVVVYCERKKCTASYAKFCLVINSNFTKT